MKDERAEYLVIDGKEITKQLYRRERVYCDNDFFNVYNRIKQIYADEIFLKNNVPEQFRKIMVKIYSSSLIRKEAVEYITGFPFDYKDKFIHTNNDIKYINMNSIPIMVDGNIIDDRIQFDTKEFYVSFNNIMYLLEEMYKKDCIENYLKSIKAFFDIYLDYGLLFEAWRTTKNEEEALGLYKTRVLEKSIVRSSYKK